MWLRGNKTRRKVVRSSNQYLFGSRIIDSKFFLESGTAESMSLLFMNRGGVVAGVLRTRPGTPRRPGSSLDFLGYGTIDDSLRHCQCCRQNYQDELLRSSFGRGNIRRLAGTHLARGDPRCLGSGYRNLQVIRRRRVPQAACHRHELWQDTKDYSSFRSRSGPRARGLPGQAGDS